MAKAPFFAAATLFIAATVLIATLAIRPLGAADLIGLCACAAAAALFAAAPFIVDFVRREDGPRNTPTATVAHISTEQLQAIAAEVESRLTGAFPDWRTQITDAVRSTLAEAEDKRRAEIQSALLTPDSGPPALDVDAIASPSSAKSRLGRGLAGLIHGAGAISTPIARQAAEESIPGRPAVEGPESTP